jgi:hypothetical protein
MAVVINEFEVVPEPPKNANQPAAKKEEKVAPKQSPTDHEVKQMLRRRMERMERISAH